MDLFGINIIYFCIIILLSVILIIFILFNRPTSIKYYPVVNIGANYNNNGPTVTRANNGIAAVSIITVSNAVPYGFTFLNNWSFNTNIGTTGNKNDVKLSNNNQTLTVQNGDQYQAIAVGNTELSGKVMYSVKLTYPGYTNEANGVGVATGGFNAVSIANNQGFAGYDSKSIAIYDSGFAYFNGLNVNTVAGDSFTNMNGEIIVDVCVDTENLLMFYRVDNGPWSNNVNPSLSIGGFSMAGLIK